MSTKTITQDILPAILKSPYAFLVFLGAGIYYISQVNLEHRTNIAEFLNIMNNIPGYMILFMIIVILFYGLFLYPLGKFFGGTLVGLYTENERHYHDADNHHEETRELIVHIGKIAENTTDIIERMQKVEGVVQYVAEKLS